MYVHVSVWTHISSNVWHDMLNLLQNWQIVPMLIDEFWFLLMCTDSDFFMSTTKHVFHYSVLSGCKTCLFWFVFSICRSFIQTNFQLKYFLYISLILPHSACVCVGQRTTCWGQFFFHHVGIKNWFCVARLGSKCLPALSHLMASLISNFFLKRQNVYKNIIEFL